MKKQSIPTCYVLFSGGLDSRLALKIMQEQSKDLAFQARDKCEDSLIHSSEEKEKPANKIHIDNKHTPRFHIIALTFKFIFGSGCCQSDCSFNFTQVQGIEHKIIDCTQGKLFKEYLKIVAKPKHGHGSGINPCIDCRIFILNKTKEMLKPHDFIVTGEVLNERPMSQYRKAMETIDKETNLSGKILRPLSAKLLDITEPEKNKLVNREKLFNVSGRSRKPQIELANKFKISYPTPAGGCLLCEKIYTERLQDLFKRKSIKKIESRDILLLKIGRHFMFKDYKIIVGRKEEENKLLEGLRDKKNEKLFKLATLPGPSVLLQGKIDEESIKQAKEHVLKFSKNKDEVIEI
jgi:tRNA-uridine 2-sulfurtransferase